MTQDEIIEMWNSVIKYAPSEVRITEFAKLVAAKATAVEREACAKLCETIGNTQANMNAAWRNGCRDAAIEIRARGQE